MSPMLTKLCAAEAEPQKGSLACSMRSSLNKWHDCSFTHLLEQPRDLDCKTWNKVTTDAVNHERDKRMFDLACPGCEDHRSQWQSDATVKTHDYDVV